MWSGDPIRYGSACRSWTTAARRLMRRCSGCAKCGRHLPQRRSSPSERDRLVFAVEDAEAAYHAALRAERTPRAECSKCKRRFKPGRPMVWQWPPALWRAGAWQLCLRCDRSEHKGNHAERLAKLDQQPCETCARPMYLDGFSWRTRRPLTCSYQCGYRRKLGRQLARKKVEPATIACVVCGEMFTQRRRDARTCSNTCRQRLSPASGTRAERAELAAFLRTNARPSSHRSQDGSTIPHCQHMTP